MSKSELIKRYILFFLSVLLQGTAIAFITYANIGTTPISSSNFVISIHSGLTLGDTTLIFNLQLPVCLIFSFMIDTATMFLSLIMPESAPYFLKWILVISGTAMLALAVAFSFTASVAMVPGEYFIKIFHPIVKKSFSYVKTFFDVFLVSSAVILSLFLTGFTEIEGVREGTVFAALCTGPMVHYFIPRCARIIPYLKPRI